MFSTIRLVLFLIILGIFAGGLWYVINLKANLAISEENNKKLTGAVAAQQDLIASIQKDIETIQKTNKELQEQNEKQRKDVENLANKFDKRDFGALAAEKPAVVERLVNRGTTNVLRCFELASGSPLNDKEKSAKTPTEANRECPSLVNPDYTAPTN